MYTGVRVGPGQHMAETETRWAPRLPFSQTMAESSQKDNASSFPTILWEPLGMKHPCPTPAKLTGNTSGTGQRAAQNSLAKRAAWKPHARRGLGAARELTDTSADPGMS